MSMMANAVDVPIIGMGGITTGADAIEFLLAGASAVAVGTAIFADPFAPLKVTSEINDYLDNNGYSGIREIVGKLKFKFDSNYLKYFFRTYLCIPYLQGSNIRG